MLTLLFNTLYIINNFKTEVLVIITGRNTSVCSLEPFSIIWWRFDEDQLSMVRPVFLNAFLTFRTISVSCTVSVMGMLILKE